MMSSARLVLDTNVVLDCFVFRDPALQALVTAIEGGVVGILVHEHTLDELRRVLAYPQCRLDDGTRQLVFDRYLAIAIQPPMPQGFNREALLLPAGFPRCRDRDDEPFLALAYHARADGLVTRDKAVLRLRRKARRFGVAIHAPTDLRVESTDIGFAADNGRRSLDPCPSSLR